MLPEEVQESADVGELARALLGEDPARGGAVLHVASTWRSPAGAAHVLRIVPGAPRSRHDAFLLSLARARAEAIVTTGRILREEPGLSHGLLGGPTLRAALTAWRRERLGLDAKPWLLVLSSGADLDPAHPAFHGPTRALLFVPEERAGALRERFAASGTRVASAPEPSLHLALAELRRLGAQRITVEAGPTTARALYAEPIAVDELWLARFAGRRLPAEAIGETFVADTALAAALPHRSPPVTREEPSGPWRFERRWR